MRIRQSVVVVGLIWAAGRAEAQQPAPPEQPVAYSIDAAVGGGRHAGQAGNTPYRYSVEAYSRAAMTVIFPQNRRMRATVTIERQSTIDFGSDVCLESPGGGCGPSFPQLAGYGASVGLRVRADSGIDLDIGAGGASMKGPTEFLIADVAFALSTHVSAVLGAQPMLLQQRTGEHLWWVPLTLGIRFD